MPRPDILNPEDGSQRQDSQDAIPTNLNPITLNYGAFMSRPGPLTLIACLALNFALLLLPLSILAAEEEAGNPTRIESIEPLEIVLAPGYGPSTRGGGKFYVHYVMSTAPLDEKSFASLGIYAGYQPKSFCPAKREETHKIWDDTIGPWKIQWRSCPSRKGRNNFMQETLIEPDPKALFLHLFIVGNDPEKMKALYRVATTLRLAKK